MKRNAQEHILPLLSNIQCILNEYHILFKTEESKTLSTSILLLLSRNRGSIEYIQCFLLFLDKSYMNGLIHKVTIILFTICLFAAINLIILLMIVYLYLSCFKICKLISQNNDFYHYLAEIMIWLKIYKIKILFQIKNCHHHHHLSGKNISFLVMPT